MIVQPGPRQVDAHLRATGSRQLGQLLDGYLVVGLVLASKSHLLALILQQQEEVLVILNAPVSPCCLPAWHVRIGASEGHGHAWNRMKSQRSLLPGPNASAWELPFVKAKLACWENSALGNLHLGNTHSDSHSLPLYICRYTVKPVVLWAPNFMH